ncbi:hypothetical protein ABZ400_32410 [Streptomyces sp. NPDC005897]|uniref:hypothetical protein n=1 Tax=Streptomyces sp. NPDC005897 TaxID=3157081 RepID=UPI0033DFEE5D
MTAGLGTGGSQALDGDADPFGTADVLCLGDDHPLPGRPVHLVILPGITGQVIALSRTPQYNPALPATEQVPGRGRGGFRGRGGESPWGRPTALVARATRRRAV